jgi:hypothetical protein
MLEQNGILKQNATSPPIKQTTSKKNLKKNDDNKPLLSSSSITHKTKYKEKR